MKTLLIVVSALIIIPCANAQQKRMSLYVSPTAKVTSVGESRGNWADLQVGCSLNEHWEIGGAFSALESDLVIYRQWGPATETTPRRITVAYAGIRTNFTPLSYGRIRNSYDLLIGDGWIGVTTGQPSDYERDRFLVVEPSTRLEVDLSRSVQLTASVGYMLTYGVDILGYTDGFLRSLALSGGLRFSVN